MESLTYQKNLKISPKKMRMIRDIIVKMSPREALDYLYYSPLKSARIYYKVIHSAIANATNALKVQADVLQFKLLTIEEGRRLKRYKAGSKGMAKPIAKEFCHVKVILIEKPQEKKALKKAEKESPKKESAQKTPERKKTESKKATEKTVKKSAKEVKKSS